MHVVLYYQYYSPDGKHLDGECWPVTKLVIAAGQVGASVKYVPRLMLVCEPDYFG